MDDYEELKKHQQAHRESIKRRIKAETQLPKDEFTAAEQRILEELRRIESYAHNLATSLEAIQATRAAQRDHQERVFKAVGEFFDGKISQSRLYEEFITI